MESTQMDEPRAARIVLTRRELKPLFAFRSPPWPLAAIKSLYNTSNGKAMIVGVLLTRLYCFSYVELTLLACFGSFFPRRTIQVNSRRRSQWPFHRLVAQSLPFEIPQPFNPHLCAPWKRRFIRFHSFVAFFAHFRIAGPPFSFLIRHPHLSIANLNPQLAKRIGLILITDNEACHRA